MALQRIDRKIQDRGRGTLPEAQRETPKLKLTHCQFDAVCPACETVKLNGERVALAHLNRGNGLASAAQNSDVQITGICCPMSSSCRRLLRWPAELPSIGSIEACPGRDLRGSSAESASQGKRDERGNNRLTTYRCRSNIESPGRAAPATEVSVRRGISLSCRDR